MGYFGSSLGGLPGVGFGGSTMFMPNAYGGYSTIAAGTPAGQEASYQLSSLRNMLSGPNAGRTAAGAMLPFMQMQVSPLDAGQRMAQTFGQSGMNLGNIMGQANQFIGNTMRSSQGQGGSQSGFNTGSPTYGGVGGSNNQQNPLSYLGGIFGQYGGGMGGGSFGSGFGGYR